MNPAADLERMAREAPRDDLPALLGAVVAVEARIRLRLSETPSPAPSAPQRMVGADEAAMIANTSRRWILAKTRGMQFRCDLSKKQPRFDEASFRAWLAARRRSR